MKTYGTICKQIHLLPDALARINDITGQKFIIIIDEWDALIRDDAENVNAQEKYIDFLRGLFKGTQPTRFTV